MQQHLSFMRTVFPSMLLIHPVLHAWGGMTEKSMRFAKQNLFQSYKSPSRKLLFGELLDQAYKSTEQLVAPILASAKKFGTTGHLWTLYHHLFTWHKAVPLRRLRCRHGPEVPKFVFMSVCFETYWHAQSIPLFVTSSVGSPPTLMILKF